MSEGMKEKSAMENLMAEWMKSSGEFWESAMKNAPSGASSASGTEDGARNRYLEAFATMLTRWKTLFATLNDPQMADTLFRGLNTLPEFYMTLAKAGWEASVRLQQQVVEKAGKIGQKTEAYKFDNLDQDLFKVWKEIYEEELQQYFKIPQLGLMRYHQERFNRFLDQWNLLQATLSDFFYILYIPVEKSFKVLQEQVDQMSREGNLPDKAKEYYNLWLKILEGHYMNLFKSPEYLHALRETLNQVEAFAVAKNLFLQDMMEGLPVPTNKDMDEMYKEMYVLKKKMKALENKMEKLQEAKRLPEA